MARLSINELTTYRWSFEEDVTHYAQAGIAAIGVWRQKLSDYGEEKGIELLSESGLAVSNLLWAGGFTGSDGRTYRDAVEDGKRAVQLAAEMKAGCLIVYSGGRAGHTANHARRLLTGALGEIAPLAEEHGVTLALEPMHPGCAAEFTFLTSLDETLSLIDSLNTNCVKLAFDTYHLCQNGMSQNGTFERLAEIAPRVAVVHLGDSRKPPDGEQNRCALGSGTLPLAEIVAALKQGGYDGYYDVELMGEEIESVDYLKLIEESKAACEKLLA